MPATRDGKLWRSQFYYKDWQGVRRKKNKRGFKTKGEADEWERNFLQQQQKNLDISFENFVEIYFADMENRLRESTIINKRYVFDLKVTPYFKHKKMCEIQRLTTLEDADEELFTPIRTMLEILNAFAEERNYERRKKEKAQK